MDLLDVAEEPCVVGSLHTALVGRPCVMAPCLAGLDSLQDCSCRDCRVNQESFAVETAVAYLDQRVKSSMVAESLVGVMARHMVAAVLHRRRDHGHY